MIRLKTTNFWTRWFAWCCDYLPLTGTRDYSEDDPNGTRRGGAWYLEHGTTLCHLFWAMFWLPLAVAVLGASVAGLFLFTIVEVHIQTYYDYGAVGLLIPAGVVAGCVAVIGALVLILIGGEKSGFFKLLWSYLRGLKDHVCPLVKFEGQEDARPPAG